jgi:hypothetical protein
MSGRSVFKKNNEIWEFWGFLTATCIFREQSIGLEGSKSVGNMKYFCLSSSEQVPQPADLYPLLATQEEASVDSRNQEVR